jgi:hypothetical protein
LGYGSLSLAQARTLRPHVLGRRIHDYGCGTLALSAQLLVLGATHVTCIDKEPVRRVPAALRSRLTFVLAPFQKYPGSDEVAFVSWPVNWDTGLHVLLRQSPVVAYLGKNADDTCCGYSQMWEELSRREAFAYVPEKRNTLIVYGPTLVARPNLPEEMAGMDHSVSHSFIDLHP